MSDDLVKRARHNALADMPHYASVDLIEALADRIEELEAENKLLNEQMAAIEEHGTESLNALPDCLMRLAPALVEIDELKAKLAKAVEALEFWQQAQEPDIDEAIELMQTTLAELKGDPDA